MLMTKEADRWSDFSLGGSSGYFSQKIVFDKCIHCWKNIQESERSSFDYGQAEYIW